MWNAKNHAASTRDLLLKVERALPDISLGMERSVAKGRGIEFHGLRSFENSDSPRDVDWMASARLSEDDTELVSREFMPEYRIRVLFVADEHLSMCYPALKPLYATALVHLFGRAAFASENEYAVIGAGGESLIFSDWLSREDDLEVFLCVADEARKRRGFGVSARTLVELLDELRLKNTLVVFLTDLAEVERIPLKALRLLEPNRNVKYTAVVLDEWSGFEPMSHSLALRHPESGRGVSLDMRRGGGMEREARAFDARLRELKAGGKASDLAVATVPLVEENPLRSFEKQWQRITDEIE